MTTGGKDPEESTNIPANKSLKQRCMDLLLSRELIKFQVSCITPPSHYNHVLRSLNQNIFLPTTNTVILKVNTSDVFTVDHQNQQVIDLKPLKDLTMVETLYAHDICIPTKCETFLTSLGSVLMKVKNLRFGSVCSSDSTMHTDEIFIQLAQSYLSKNRDLSHVDLRGSDVDLVADCSRRNLPINLAAEMRRWARRLRSLAFETEINLCRVLRILNRQSPLLKTLCISPAGQQSVCDMFDNLKSISEHCRSRNEPVEKMEKLSSLCLCRHFKVTDLLLRSVLPSLPALKYLNVAGCAVNLKQYWHLLPSTLEELIIDECDRRTLLKCNRSSVRQLFRKCPYLTIYVSPPTFEAENFESLRGLALLNGAKSILSDKTACFNSTLFDEEEDGLIAFELRVKELEYRVTCIKLF